VESQNVFADEVQSRPKLLEAYCAFTFFIAKADSGDVVRECLKPNVHRVFGIVWHRDAPAYRSTQAANGKIL
jgi:hypothetical protein